MKLSTGLLALLDVENLVEDAKANIKDVPVGFF